MRGHTLSAFVKLLVFAVVTVLATAVLAVTISNRTFGPTHTFRAEFVDVTGLLPGDSVRAAGVRVGTVDSITVVNQRYAQVTFDVDTDVPVLDSTRLEIRYLNLVGQRYVALVEQPGNGAPQPRNATIPLSRTAPALDLTALFNGFRPLFKALTPEDVNSFALEVIKTLQGEGGTVADLVAKSADLTNTVADRDAAIGQVVNNLLTVLDTVDKRNAGLNETIVQLQRLVTGLASDRNTIAASLGNIDSLASNSALLLQQIRPYLPSELTSLAAITNTLNTTKNADGQNTLDEYLKRAPTKLIQIIRTAQYGSFFNFYLCDLQMTGQLGDIVQSLTGKVPTISVNVPACQATS
jgi:phospholipid/cholesterol/gamma-HCH transport system substrate-binding protein